MENHSNIEFKKFYQQSLLPELNRMEASRKVVLFILGILLISILFLWWFSFYNGFSILILFSLALTVLFVMFFNFKNGQLENTFKESLVNRILSFQSDQINQDKLQYFQLCLSEPSDFEDCILLKSVKSGIKSENLFNGLINGTSFEACQIKYLFSNSESDTKALIQAWFYKLEVPYMAKDESIILPKSLKKYFTKEIRSFIKKGAEKIVDEDSDSDFYKNFEVWAIDPFHFRLWMTSDLQNALLDAEESDMNIAIAQKEQFLTLLSFSDKAQLPYSLLHSFSGFKISETYHTSINNIFLPLKLILK